MKREEEERKKRKKKFKEKRRKEIIHQEVKWKEPTNLLTISFKKKRCIFKETKNQRKGR